MEAARITWRPLGRLLVEQGLLREDELEHALAEQVSTGRRLGETLIDLGFVTHGALSHALAEQYGIEPKTETGFGTGLRAELERRSDRDRDGEAETGDVAPALRLVPDAAGPEPEVPESHTIDDGDGYSAQLEEQWAKLAAAEAELLEAKRELTVLRQRAQRRREQAARLVARIRKRDRLIVELSATDREEPAQASVTLDVRPARGHLVYAAVAGRYVLAERDGEPPEPDAILELPELGEERLIVCRVGRSPLPNDPRPCAFAQPVSEP